MNIIDHLGWFNGQEFLEDTERITVVIQYHLYTNVYISKFRLSQENCNIQGQYYERGFVIEYERKISKKLFECIKENQRGAEFIYGILSEIIPLINTEINKQKYSKGQILNRPISCFDIKIISILNEGTKESVSIDGHFILRDFRKLTELKAANDHVFIRDLIDAMTSYLFNNYDDCIRKLITSIENFFITPGCINGQFNVKLAKLLSDEHYPNAWSKYLKILNSNMKFIYSTRNKILHDKLRAKFDDSWQDVCHHGIATLQYVYRNSLNTQDTANYVQLLFVQYSRVTNYTHRLNLDKLERLSREKSSSTEDIIGTSADIDRIMFKGLKISEDTRRIILSGQ